MSEMTYPKVRSRSRLGLWLAALMLAVSCLVVVAFVVYFNQESVRSFILGVFAPGENVPGEARLNFFGQEKEGMRQLFKYEWAPYVAPGNLSLLIQVSLFLVLMVLLFQRTNKGVSVLMIVFAFIHATFTIIGLSAWTDAMLNETFSTFLLSFFVFSLLLDFLMVVKSIFNLSERRNS